MCGGGRLRRRDGRAAGLTCRPPPPDFGHELERGPVCGPGGARALQAATRPRSGTPLAHRPRTPSGNEGRVRELRGAASRLAATPTPAVHGHLRPSFPRSAPQMTGVCSEGPWTGCSSPRPQPLEKARGGMPSPAPTPQPPPAASLGVTPSWGLAP